MRIQALPFLLCSSMALAAPAAPAKVALDGAWEGTLSIGAIKLRVVFKIARDGDKWKASLDSPDQGARDIPVDEVKLEGQKLTLYAVKIAGKYEGTIAGDKATGTWTQRGNPMPLDLVKTAHPTQVSDGRPQDPKPPYPYAEVELTVDNVAGKAKLACTLTEPRGPGPFPAAVMITGSGAQDRNEALMGHRPFLVIADALTRRGIAVLRCDDRGFAKSTGDVSSTTVDFAGDTLAELEALRARPEIDRARVGLIGHSEGGVIAPMVAAQSKDVAFIVMLAGTGLPGEEIVNLQRALIAKAMGASDEAVRKESDRAKQAFALLRTVKSDAELDQKLKALFADPKQPDEAGAVGMQIHMLESRWFREFLVLDPRVYLKQVKVPVLAVNGERDLQVPPKANLPEIAKALAGNPDVTVKELPELNHLFQHCKTGAPAEYATIQETFSPDALGLVGDWIAKHTKK